ncbi:hypothetical protein [Methylobacterium komagatae]
MPYTRFVASILCLVPFAALAQGTPRSIGECERLKNDLAYNQCLAMFGPAAKNVAAGYASADAAAAPALQEASPAEAQAEADAAPAGAAGPIAAATGANTPCSPPANIAATAVADGHHNQALPKPSDDRL